MNFIIVIAALVLSTGFADKLVPALVSAERAVRGGDSFVEARFVRRVRPLYQEGTPIPDEIWAQTEEAKNLHLGSRAALWRDHVGAFLSSPLIGVGRDGAIAALQQRSLDSSKTGSESFFTRILAEFGIIGLLFWAAVWRLFVHFDRMDSAAGRSLPVAFTAILALYGSSALPYSFITLAFIALIGKASSHDGHRGATRQAATT